MTRMPAALLLPGKTIVNAKNSMSAGDTTYIENGVSQTSEDNFTAYLSMDKQGASNSGTAAAPMALDRLSRRHRDDWRGRRSALRHSHAQHRHQ